MNREAQNYSDFISLVAGENMFPRAGWQSVGEQLILHTTQLN